MARLDLCFLESRAITTYEEYLYFYRWHLTSRYTQVGYAVVSLIFVFNCIVSCLLVCH